MAILIIIHAIGVVAAVIAAFVDIESILVSGVLLTVTGYFIAVLSFRAKRICGLLYGLIAPAAAIVTFVVINKMRWSPSDAQVPISIALSVFGLDHLPVGWLAYLEAKRGGTPSRRPLQFSILSLLLLMFVVAIPLGLARTFEGGDLALGLALGYGIYTNYLAILAEVRRRRSEQPAKLPDPPDSPVSESLPEPSSSGRLGTNCQ